MRTSDTSQIARSWRVILLLIGTCLRIHDAQARAKRAISAHTAQSTPTQRALVVALRGGKACMPRRSEQKYRCDGKRQGIGRDLGYRMIVTG